MAKLTPAEVLRRGQAKARRERLELALLQQIRAAKLPEPERQYRFHPERMWRSDFAFLDDPFAPLLVEVDGGTWSGGRHTRGAGYQADCEKANEAVLHGWLLLRVTGAHIKSGAALEWIRRALG